MKPHTTRAALYSRVSTTDKGQDAENQLAPLRAFCERQGYTVYKEYVDHESGRKGRRERAAFAQLFEDAAARRFDLVDWRQLLFRSTTHVTFLVSHYLALSVAFHKGLVYNTLNESLL